MTRSTQWLADSDSLTQFLLQGEQILFFSEKAAVKRHLSRGLQFVTARSAYNEPGGIVKVQISGPLAITDKRIFLVSGIVDGVFSSHSGIRFQAIYDSEYARQTRIDILTEASPQKVQFLEQRSLGESKDYVLLKRRSVGGNTVASAVVRISTLGSLDINKEEWELRLQKPLFMKSEVLGLTDSGAESWFTPILAHLKGKADVGYEPILEIMQAKSSEISNLVGELEAPGSAPVPVEPGTPLAPPASAPAEPVVNAESWLAGYLEPGERVQFQSMSDIWMKTSSLSARQCKLVLTDRKLLVHSEHGTLKDGQNVLLQKLDEVREIKFRKAPSFVGTGMITIQGSSTKMELQGVASEIEGLSRLLENRRRAPA